jgi:hypothetical protein
MVEPFVLLVGVEQHLFEACFGNEDGWPCVFKWLDEECPLTVLASALNKEGLKSVVFQDYEGPHWDLLKGYYNDGGLLIYFGVYGEFQAPVDLSSQLGFRWRFSAYTTHEYTLTAVGRHYLGNVITEQQYTKANLLQVPEEDRLMIPKVPSLKEYIDDQNFDDDEPSPQELEVARKSYEDYRQELLSQVPLAMHRADNGSGGRFVYLGFVNGDGNIPKIVRALCTNLNIQS